MGTYRKDDRSSPAMARAEQRFPGAWGTLKQHASREGRSSLALNPMCVLGGGKRVWTACVAHLFLSQRFNHIHQQSLLHTFTASDILKFQLWR